MSVVGCGKIGACLAAALASRGFRVTAIDTDSRKVELLNRGEPPVEEPKLGYYLASGKTYLKSTTDHAAAKDTDASFFIVPTPSNKDGSFSNEHLLQAVTAVADVVRKAKKKNHLFVINSTTTPGSIDSQIIPKIKSVLKTLPFGVCYNPEFIALGNVFSGLMQPDFVLIGEIDDDSGSRLAGLYYRLCCPAPSIKRMSVTAAELCKISVNGFITMKISFANYIGMIAGRMGLDRAAILDAVGTDRRIGNKYLSAGGAYGGPCFPRDNRLLQYVGRRVRVGTPLPLATDLTNSEVKSDLLKRVKLAAGPPKGSVAVLGLAYKEGTEITEESTGLFLAEQLKASGYTVYVHDARACDPAYAYCDPASLKDMPELKAVVAVHTYPSLALHKHTKLIRP